MTMFATPSQSHAGFKAPSFYRALILAMAARRQRKALKSLDNAHLSDIGLTYAQAMKEANRPVWDVPAHWRR